MLPERHTFFFIFFRFKKKSLQETHLKDVFIFTTEFKDHEIEFEDMYNTMFNFDHFFNIHSFCFSEYID